MLPVVSEDTRQTLFREISRKMAVGFNTQLFSEVNAKNPEVAEMIRQFISNNAEEGLHSPAVMSLPDAISMALLVYKQLESQAEADELNSLFQLD